MIAVNAMGEGRRISLKGLDRQERELFRRIRESGDSEAQEELFFRYENLLAFFAHKYASSSYPFDEVYQVAALGLLKAIKRFDPDKGTAFSTFAYPTIDGELKRFYRDHGEAVRLPRQLYELKTGLKSLEKEGPALRGLGPAEMAKRLRCTEKELAEALWASEGSLTLSLEQGSQREGEDEGRRLSDTLGNECLDLAGAELRVVLEEAMRDLEERERRAVEEYFFRGMTQTAIARQMGVSQMQVSRLMRQALEKIRSYFDQQVFA